jgi:hypothetical protein
MIPVLNPPKFRLVWEMSNMSNNDEWVAHVEKSVTREESIPKELADSSGWSRYERPEPRFIFCRPVYEIEVKEGLDLNEKPKAIYDCGISRTPESTQLIDSIFRFAEEMKKESFLAKSTGRKMRSPTDIIVTIASCQYYDCMSGGIPTYLMSILKYLMESIPGIDFTKPVYPGKEKVPMDNPEDYQGWWTLRDFYETAKDSPDLKREAPQILGVLNSQLMLGSLEPV